MLAQSRPKQTFNIMKQSILRQKTAKTLRTIRMDRGLSQEQLAKKSGIDRTYISGVERGVRNITLDSLETIILALDTKPELFLIELQKSFSD